MKEAEEIALATPKDEQAVYALICELEKQPLDRQAFGRIYQENLQSEHIRYLICHRQGRVCGFCSLFVQSPLHHAGRIGEVQELIVYPGGAGGRYWAGAVIQSFGICSANRGAFSWKFAAICSGRRHTVSMNIWACKKAIINLPCAFYKLEN